MVNQIIERMWSTGLSLLSPGYLVDWLLDQIEKLSPMMMPAPIDMPSCQQRRVETRLD
ncbi:MULTISPECIES: hypothetical protein [unclassified Bradyrhizobium]|uniref:hypothetical protein n=1 Tax=unclassified Bradyrhizobium TaxID=2631580 RepID=UPI002479C992|nr:MULTISPECIES: hypothetical protein [unclassified Bradyrhizobium]WGR71977.1 hypothetical protein MTX24_03155 [Bradyrhizobium sp. ISRA426]WGR76811.1 hypothetical protein MTX21_28105 [Bradyrhizobium sp. ISRA430]WGR87216.1 hypothetical protein MTX25_03155 [Bradyrhizobium sp. ISRA432]